MWILLFIFYTYPDPQVSIRVPTSVQSVEFSSEASCEAAKARLADGLGAAGNLKMGCFKK